ncbi:WD40/YVTN/BNR-like repeat-containing protein [Solimonas soli]|uniref:WD40/YVTN/BNR-like repeat-containing protein n=1 Tax=Solimonas soli TaxID=413479 RepID=UPI0004843317|nr:YCF48-related protein [Solimonas soli]
MRHSLSYLLICGLALASAGAAAANTFKDPAVTPAPEVPNSVSSAPLLAGALSGTRIVAVGLRGVIATSDDQGKTWKQQPSPVSSDLVALSFVGDGKGWAAGHDGVVLHTEDGGNTWVKQFDGAAACKRMTAYYQQKLDGGDASVQPYIMQVKGNCGDGAGDLPWLDVLFVDEHNGYLVGPFGNIMATADGGANWEPWQHRIDNDRGLHLNQITRINGELYIAAEQGVVFKWDAGKQKFKLHQTPYKGTFFGITGDSAKLIAFGLRGTAYASADAGETWTAIETDAGAAVNAAATLADGRVIMVTQNARVLLSTDAQARQFKPLTVTRPMLFADVVPIAPDAVAVFGTAGVAVESLATGR